MFLPAAQEPIQRYVRCEHRWHETPRLPPKEVHLRPSLLLTNLRSAISMIRWWQVAEPERQLWSPLAGSHEQSAGAERVQGSDDKSDRGESEILDIDILDEAAHTRPA